MDTLIIIVLAVFAVVLLFALDFQHSRYKHDMIIKDARLNVKSHKIKKLTGHDDPDDKKIFLINNKHRV